MLDKRTAREKICVLYVPFKKNITIKISKNETWIVIFKPKIKG